MLAEVPDEPAPFDGYRDVVRPEWIDHNGHMNMGYYLVVFDLATDAWFRHVGLGEAHREAQHVTTFCLEAHITYHREVREGDPLRFTTRLLAWTPSASTISMRCTTLGKATSRRPTS